jgi:hypothetical protein
MGRIPVETVKTITHDMCSAPTEELLRNLIHKIKGKI